MNGFEVWEQMEDVLIDAAVAYLKDLFAGNADGHDAEHTLRVYRNAMKIADKVVCDRQVVALAALLHDADDHKLFRTTNNANARSFLNDHGVGRDKADQVINAVNAVSFSKNKDKRPDTIEGQIVQDADRLDALGAIGIARTFAYGGKHDRGMTESVQHFHDKLLLLKDRMNTEAAMNLAAKRHAYLLEFLREWDREIGE